MTQIWKIMAFSLPCQWCSFCM